MLTKEISEVEKDKFILDACCGCKMMWFNKNHPNTLYIDIRKEPKGFIKGRNESINPDKIMDFRELEFKDKSFKLVAWDIPHLITLGETSKFKKFFGKLDKNDWKKDIEKGFKEIMRVLDDYGVLMLKFNDYEIPFKELLSIFPVEPLFGNVTNSRGKAQTKWFCFMKIPEVKDAN
jgi:hypothetical protein